MVSEHRHPCTNYKSRRYFRLYKLRCFPFSMCACVSSLTAFNNGVNIGLSLEWRFKVKFFVIISLIKYSFMSPGHYYKSTPNSLKLVQQLSHYRTYKPTHVYQYLYLPFLFVFNIIFSNTFIFLHKYTKPDCALRTMNRQTTIFVIKLENYFSGIAYM